MYILTISFHMFRCLFNIEGERKRVLSSSKEAEKKRKQRLRMSNEKRIEENNKMKHRMRESRLNKTSEEKIVYNNKMKHQMKTSRSNMTSEIATE